MESYLLGEIPLTLGIYSSSSMQNSAVCSELGQTQDLKLHRKHYEEMIRMILKFDIRFTTTCNFQCTSLLISKVVAFVHFFSRAQNFLSFIGIGVYKKEWICSLFKEWILEKSEIRVNLEWIWSEHCVIHSFWSDLRDHSESLSDPCGHSKMSE